ncbi:hypothetical protein ABZ635_01820 [Nocardiopsis sp. NPDC007018]|uniref:hypothetical protein n=1 Tax=Nocardiopsis sp. NPDC007018 TaxID=3155721 RepID=UPI0034023A10
MLDHSEGAAAAPTARRLVRTGFVLALALAVSGAWLAPASAGPDPHEVPPEVQAWFETSAHREIVEDPEGETYEEYLQGLGVSQVREQEVHEPHPVWQWTEEFVRGGAGASDDPIAFTETWVAAVSVNGSPGAVVEAVRENDGAIAFASMATAGDTAEGLLELEDGEVLVYEFPLNAWYAVGDGTLRGINHEGLREVPGSLSLEEYAQRTEERYAEDLALPHDTESVGGARFTEEGASASSWLLPGGLAALVLVGAGTAAVRRGSVAGGSA